MISSRLILRSVSWFLVIVFFPTFAFATDTYSITDGGGSGNTLIANGTNVIGPGATTGTLEVTHASALHYHGVLNGVADPNPDGGADQSGWGHASLVLPPNANPLLPTNSTDTVYLTTSENPGGENSSAGGSGGTYVPVDFQVTLWLAQLLVSITIPGLITAPIKANEGSAAGTLRTLATPLDAGNVGIVPNLSQNDLQEAAKSLEKTLSDMDAADAHIRDADLSKETSELVKGKEAEDAGKAALAEANSAPQNVMALLR